MGGILTAAMSPKRKDLILMVWDGDDRTLRHLWMVNNLYRADEVLAYLIQNRLTGKRLVAFIEEDHKGSLLKAMCEVLRRINRDLEAKPLIVGKDIR